jgi:type IV secretory pathway VirD2 relaxase
VNFARIFNRILSLKMLQERFKNMLEMGAASDGADALLGDEINSRKSYFQRIGMSAGGRKKSFRSGAYRRGNLHSSRPISQRVIVKAHYKKHAGGGSGGAGNLRGHLSYISRAGAGVDGERPDLFGEVGGEVSGEARASDFYNLCKDDRHHFRVIISPENAHEIPDMSAYICGVMGQVQEDLGTKLTWVSAIHYDTNNPHAHVIIRGKDGPGKDLVIAPDYISNGIRMRAEELATEILGERSIEEVQRSMEKETDAMRVTSLDRYIEGCRSSGKDRAEGEKIALDTRARGFTGRGEFYDGLIKKRLEFLSTAAMAVQDPPGVFAVRAGYTDELRKISERHDIIKQLHRIMPGEEQGVRIYDASHEDAPAVLGRIEKIAHINELTDHKYMVVRDGHEQAYYVALAQGVRSDALQEGMIVEVSSGRQSGKSDRNIALIADRNGGIYTRAAHLDHVLTEMKFIEDPEGYVDYHGVRLQTLEKAAIVEQGEDGYVIPQDLAARGAELNEKLEKSGWKKKSFARVREISKWPVQSQIDVHARTWLDLEIYRHQKGHDLSYTKADKGTMDALQARMAWLAEHGYGTYKEGDGQFLMNGDALHKLYRAELEVAGERLAEVLKARGYTFSFVDDRHTQDMHYKGFVDLHSGHHIVAEKDGFISLIRSHENTQNWLVNEPICVSKNEKGVAIERDILDQSKEETLRNLSEAVKLPPKDLDITDEAEMSYIGAVHLKEGAFAVVSDDDHVALVRLKEYPVYEPGQAVVLSAGQDGFAEIKEAGRQQELELELESASHSEKSKDQDVEIDW